MDNLTHDFVAIGFAGMWSQVGEKPIQLIAASDIGHFAAMALLFLDQYTGRAIGIVRDELNFDQISTKPVEFSRKRWASRCRRRFARWVRF